MSNKSQFSGAFFLGTDTEVGKTFQARRLIRQLRSRQVDVGVYKPVASGVARVSKPSANNASPDDLTDPYLTDEQSDPYLLWQAAELSRDLLPRVCPQTFEAPLAPPSAAALEGRSVDENLIREGFQWWRKKCKVVIVEGAGGVMSPISSTMTCLDFAVEFQLPVVLVAANRLGCVSHTLLAAEAIQRRNLNLLAILLNELGDRHESSIQGYSLGNSELQNPHPARLREITSHSSRQLIQSFLPSVPLIEDAAALLD